MPMNPTYKQLWLEKLESGDYQQAEGKLCTGEAYCCLGVLCEAAGAVFNDENDYDEYPESEPEFMPTPILIDGRTISLADGEEVLTEEALALFGLTSEEELMLIYHNDGRAEQRNSDGDILKKAVEKKSFAEIAKIIRETL